MDHRNRRLAAAGDHVHVFLVEKPALVHGGNDVGTHGGGSEIDGDLACLAQPWSVCHVGPGAGGVENNFDLRAGENGLDAGVIGRDALLAGAGETVRLRVDACEQHEFHRAGLAQDFIHQIGADVARAKNGDFDFSGGKLCVHGWAGNFFFGKNFSRLRSQSTASPARRSITCSGRDIPCASARSL